MVNSTRQEAKLRRVVEPEILDRLAPDDPRALRARRDLRWVNAAMLQDVIIARTLRKYAVKPPRVLVDLGSGDGTFMLRLARRLAPHWRNLDVVLVDQQDAVMPRTRAAFAALGWNATVAAENVLDFLARDRPADLVTANMFLHHLHEPDLVRVLAAVAGITTLFVAGELRRTRFVRETGRFLWLLGRGEVICHDGRVSANAAFLGHELSALWPQQREWTTDERAVGPWTHLFVARRSAA